MSWNEASSDSEPQAPPQPSPAAPPDAPPPASATPIQEPAAVAPVSPTAPRRRGRVLVRAAIAAVLLVGVGVLAFFLVTTLGQLNSARNDVTSLRSQLASTKALLSATKAELVTADDASAAQHDIDNYAGSMFSNVGALQQNLDALGTDCPGSTCSTDLANVESAAARFQAGGTYGLKVPPVLASADAEIRSVGDEYVKGAKMLVAALNSGNQSSLLTALSTLSAADTSFAKAVSDVGDILLRQT